MGKQKIDKCNEIGFGHRSTPQPHSHFEAEWKSATGKKKKNSFCLFLCIFVSFLPSKLFCLLSYRVFICFCFVRKAYQKPKWIWKHLHRCPPRATCYCCCFCCCRCSQSFSVLKIHLPQQMMTIWMENGTWSYYALCSRFQGAGDVPWWCWTRVANWGVHEQMICKIKMNRCNVLLQ